MSYSFAQNKVAPTPQAELLDDVLDRTAREFFKLHTEILALSKQTGMAAPSLVKAARDCNQTLNDGAVPLMQNAAFDVVSGALGMGAALQATANVAAEIYADKAQNANPTKPASSSVSSFNTYAAGRRGAKGQAQAQQTATARSVLFGASPAVKPMAAAPKPANQRGASLADLQKAQLAKQKQFMDVMPKLRQLNDMKAMGVETVAQLEDGIYSDMGVAPVAATSTAKTPNRARMFKPAFAPVPAFGGLVALAG